MVVTTIQKCAIASHLCTRRMYVDTNVAAIPFLALEAMVMKAVLIDPIIATVVRVFIKGSI